MKEDRKETVSKRNCAHPKCRRVCSADCYCYGCRRFICEKHCTNLLVMSFGHPVASHWTIED